MIILMEDYDMVSFSCEINFELVKFVCGVCDEFEVKDLSKLCYVVGVFGLMLKICFILLDVNDFGYCNINFDKLVVVYVELILVLMEGGVDFILIEIIFDMFNVKVVLFVVEEVFE